MTLADREVLITRTFEAPRDLVFQAWTDPRHLPNWFAPPGCAIEFRSLDVRAGGSFHSCIRTPDGSECWCLGSYREVLAPKVLVFTMGVADSEGNLIDPLAAGMDPEWPRETLVTVLFEEADGITTVTLHHTVSEALAKRTGAHPSSLLMFDRLADLLIQPKV